MENLKNHSNYDYQKIYQTGGLPTDIEIANKLSEVIMLANQCQTDIITLNSKMTAMETWFTNKINELEKEKEALRKLKL